MANSGHDADAAFFNLMHHFMAASHKSESGADLADGTEVQQRTESRRPFRLTQAIAPGYCWEVPPASAWLDVLCHDLAQNGFSFFLDEKPWFERLVAKFRSAEPIYVAARVRNYRPVLVDAWGGVIESCIPSAGTRPAIQKATSKFLVGCRFLRRFPT